MKIVDHISMSRTRNSTLQLVSMLSDIAGHAGLWLGLSGIYYLHTILNHMFECPSVISVVEFFGLFFMVVLTCVRGRKMVSDEDAIGVSLC